MSVLMPTDFHGQKIEIILSLWSLISRNNGASPVKGYEFFWPIPVSTSACKSSL